MTDEDAQQRKRRFNRRRYLATVGLGAATATAGCTVSFEDGIKIDFGEPNDETQTPTEVGYGGTATTAATVATTATQSATDDSTDSTDSPSPTDSDTPTAEPESEDDYGETGYGRLDYGG